MDLAFDPENYFKKNNDKEKFYKIFNNWKQKY